MSKKRVNAGFLKVILAIQLIFLSFFVLDYIGIEIPILRQLFCFVYLAFIPGILILGILKLDKLNIIETILYSVGLSCSFLIFVGLFTNTVYPVFGITKPLSTTSLLITLIALISALYLLCCIRNAGYIPSSFANLDTNTLFSPYTLSFLLIPFLAIFGAYSVCFHDNNILLLLLLLLIAVIPIFVAFDKIPSKIYPIVVFLIAISLLFHNVLSSMYLQGDDLHLEYHLTNLVKLNSYWNASIPQPLNTVLSNVILAPIFSNVCEIELVWVFKLIYPFLFSLVPVGLYQAYKEETNEKVAFLSCFLFMSSFVFYTEMLQLAKQMLAEFFITLLMLLMISKRVDTANRALLSVIIVSSIIVSHYGVAWIFVISLFFALLFNVFRGRKDSSNAKIVTSNLAMLSLTLVVAWHLYTASSSALESVVALGNRVINSISELFSPVEKGSVYWMTREDLPMIWSILRILYMIVAVSIYFGFLNILYKLHKKKEKTLNLSSEYLLFSATFIGWLSISTIWPRISGVGSIGFTRMFHISSIFLAPFAVIGGIDAGRTILKLCRRDISVDKNIIKVISIFLMIFLLFNSSLISEIVQETIGGDYAVSPSISQPRIKKEGTEKEKIVYYAFNYPVYDVLSARWLGIHRDHQKEIIGDCSKTGQILSSYGMIWGEEEKGSVFKKMNPVDPKMAIPNKKSYVYLRKINYVDGLMHVDPSMRRYYGYGGYWWNASDIIPLLEIERSKIYSNGGSVIYE